MEFGIAEIWALLLTNTVFLAVLGWLAKSIVQHFLSRDIEKFKLELKAESDKKIEAYKHSFEIERTRLQISFSEIFAQQAKIIIELYEIVLELEGRINDCLDMPVQRQEFKLKLDQLKDLYHRQRILIPEKLDDYIGDLLERGFEIWSGSFKEDCSEELKKTFREAKELCLSEIRLLLSVNVRH